MTGKTTYPLVTIGILSYNRCDDLRNTLIHLLEDEYANSEILLIDNASTDGTVAMLQQEFTSAKYPRLRILRNESNLGIQARNFLFDEAKGKYFFSFDDDSYPSTGSMITQTVSIMESDPSIAVLCCSCIHPVTGYNETRGIERFATGGSPREGYDLVNIAAGGSAFRMEDIRQTKGYDPDFFHGREENDLAFQLVHRDKRIVFCPQLIVSHLMSGSNRDVHSRLKYVVRNTLWLLWKYFPFPVSIPMALLFSIRRFLSCVKDVKRFGAVMRGLACGISGYRRMKMKAHRFSLTRSLKLWRSLWKMLYE